MVQDLLRCTAFISCVFERGWLRNWYARGEHIARSESLLCVMDKAAQRVLSGRERAYDVAIELVHLDPESESNRVGLPMCCGLRSATFSTRRVVLNRRSCAKNSP